MQAQTNIQKVVEITLKKYKNGTATFSEVLNSEQNLIKAQEDVIAERAQIMQNVIAYYKASGAIIDN